MALGRQILFSLIKTQEAGNCGTVWGMGGDDVHAYDVE
jgi:hypothetical protein